MQLGVKTLSEKQFEELGYSVQFYNSGLKFIKIKINDAFGTHPTITSDATKLISGSLYRDSFNSKTKALTQRKTENIILSTDNFIGYFRPVKNVIAGPSEINVYILSNTTTPPYEPIVPYGEILAAIINSLSNSNGNPRDELITKLYLKL